MNRKTEVLIGSILLLIIIGFIGYNILNSDNNKFKILNKIDEAILEEDIAFLKNHIEMVDGEKLDDQTIKDVVISLKENNIRSEDLLLNENEEDMVNPIKIIKDGKKNLIYDNYKIVLEYYDLFINTNISSFNPEVFINGEKQKDIIISDDMIALQGVKPGFKEFSIKYKGTSEVESDFEESILITNSITLPQIDDNMRRKVDNYGKNIPYFIDFYEYFKMVDVYVDLPRDVSDVFLVINGQKTNTIINDAPVPVGPVFDEEYVIKGVTKINGKEYHTNECDLNEFHFNTCELYLDYEDNTDTEQKEGANDEPSNNTANNVSEKEVFELLETYIIGLAEAINHNEFVRVSYTIDSDSPLYKMQKDLVDRLGKTEIQEELIDFNYKDITYIGNDKYQVKVLEKHKIMDYSGEKEDKIVENAWLYTIIRKNGELYMYNLEEANF